VNKTIEKNLTWTSGIAGIAIGAFAMYFSDPDRGRRRRALVRDQVQHWAREAVCAFDVAARDLGNRLQGVRARTRNLISRRGDIPDVILEERVRARLGRTTTHPRAIKVLAQEGHINLSGAVLAHEKDDVIDTVQSTPGIVGVSDNMQSYETAEHIPSLQGNHELQRVRSALAPDSWSPSTRAIAALGGCTLGCYGLIRRSPADVALATLGFGLLATGVLSKGRAPRRRHDAGSHAGKQTHARDEAENAGKIAEKILEEDGLAAAPHQATLPQPGTLLH
jgi:hypothetical protein